MDSLIRWAVQAVPVRGRHYRTADAVVVTGTGLNRRDRIVVAGDPAAVQPLLDAAIVDHPSHVVLGDTALVGELRGLAWVADFGWMDLLPDAPAPGVDTTRVRWLDDAEVASVLAVANPGSWAQPGEANVLAWAGVADVHAKQTGPIASVGALAHCSDDVAFLAGVATLLSRRGQGLSTAVCGFLRDHGRATRGTVALMVDRDNATAIALYRRLGFRYRSVTAARPAPPRPDLRQ